MAHLNQDPELANIIAQSIKEYDEQQLRNIHVQEYYKHLSDDDLELKRVLEQTQNLDTDLTSANVELKTIPIKEKACVDGVCEL